MNDVLNIYVYEVKKGTKPLALMTVPHELCEDFVKKIQRSSLELCVQNIGQKDNIFFGLKECVDIVRRFLDKNLCDLTDEEDFILGIMLGYSRLEQCRRYLNRQKYTHAGNSRMQN